MSELKDYKVGDIITMKSVPGSILVVTEIGNIFVTAKSQSGIITDYDYIDSQFFPSEIRLHDTQIRDNKLKELGI